MERYQVGIVGSGFAGTILARALRSAGLEVILLEKASHPRFAIGESSTPLAALALERLARAYGLVDLGWLAAYGRWIDHLPQIRRGLKRGFTFYRHRPGRPLQASADNPNRLLVAASPNDAVADSHWLRADVDAFLVDRAIEEGVRFIDRVAIQAHRGAREWHLGGSREGNTVDVSVEVLIDASGPAAISRQALPNASRVEDLALDTLLVFGHYSDLAELPDLGPGPYPDQAAAVHHLLDEGWMYVLPFDHGVASVGLVLRRSAVASLARGDDPSPMDLWSRVVERYPSLAHQLEPATPHHELEMVPRAQRLLTRAAGADWAMLPHTYAFLDPMFSMGIAWSLLAVERLAGILVASTRRGHLDRHEIEAGFARYGDLLRAEVEQMTSLLEGAWLAMDDFELFTAQSFLYFAQVSFAEVEQRLELPGRSGLPAAWRAFLGADEPESRQLFAAAKSRLTDLAAGPGRSAETTQFTDWIRQRIASRNIAGLADPARHNLYPVDLDLLLERSSLLGMERHQLEPMLPLLRGASSAV